MSDVVRAITRKNSLRAVLRELSLVQIEKLMSDVSEIHQELFEEKQAAQAAEEKRQRKIIELKALMLQEGIDPSDIAPGFSSTPMKKPVKPKYRHVDSNGAVLEWTGRGRTPLWVIEYESNGGNRDSLLLDC
jgi:DNA-binding protein H-NS